MASTEEYLLRLEQRVSRLEALIEGGAAARAAAAAPVAPVLASATPAAQEPRSPVDPLPTATPAPPPPVAAARPPRHVPAAPAEGHTITQLMGWAGAALLVLAAAYLVRLVYDTGWFTPPRQVAVATLAGVALIAAGLRLRVLDAAYASLLPAAGLVVLFIATYGAHLVYHLVGLGIASAAIVAICLAALWLGRVFAAEVYALFAVVGSYSAPLLLLPSTPPRVPDLALYFTAWSLVFCAHALMTASRRPYLLAGYMALLSFSAATRLQGDAGAWLGIVAFQCVQFAVFLGAAVFFSVLHERPMTREEATGHLPLLLLFYALQYVVLHAHVPDTVPWLAIASAAVLWGGYALARAMLRVRLEAGAVVVGWYVALVLFHAVYLELVPDRWGPAFSLVLLPIAGLYGRARPVNTPESFPFKLAVGLIVAINFLRVVVQDEGALAGGAQLLTLGYAVELFAAYALLRGHPGAHPWTTWLLWAAQAAALRFLWLLAGGGLLASVAWALLALAELVVAFRAGDQGLGKSALLVFAVCLAKLVVEDLAHAQQLVRIGSLVVVGVALYAGGGVYKRLAALEAGRT